MEWEFDLWSPHSLTSMFHIRIISHYQVIDLIWKSAKADSSNLL